MKSFLLGLAGALALVACSDDTSDPGGNGSGNANANASGNGNGSGGNGGDGCDTDFSRLAGMNVSFQNDVMPIFGLSCSIGSACHSKEGTPRASLYLGPSCQFNADTRECLFEDEPLTQAILDEVYSNMDTGLVGVASSTAPSVQRVVPNQPENSFLIQKIADIHNDQGHADCGVQDSRAMPPCGDGMPPTGDALCLSNQARFDTIAAWVLAGAPNN